ncbi:multidrug resistance ABC transporter ATP-binding/permease BrmA [Gracilibacillus halophilus YIM-C55.5]|uniref:Multidrug resistance ABC transporter ATP-binding/permease BrmA n=1 Tax=Gracilibacillus halophilus YIM-C55.5 TaxID=1308866 RepID=N4WEZ9_9BACI|nr:ABC transporter ATP-binding protein [Gracilibacillus halophilus]ENH97844.1 multidrug resistance ABC transporter ATP-binding/permease BrmA [Gracilibacillus halophilus YIM-C55.5]
MKKNTFFLKRIWDIAQPSRMPFFGGIIFSIISVLFSITIPLIIMNVMNDLSGGISSTLILFLILFLVLEIIFSSLSIYLLSLTGEFIVKKVRSTIFERLLNVSVSFYQSYKPGGLVSRITNDTTVIVNIISKEFPDLIASFLSFSLSLIILFLLDVPMTLMLLIAVPVTIFIVIPIGKKIFDISNHEQLVMSKLTSFLSQKLYEVKLIKAFNAQNKEIEKGEENFQELYNYGLKGAKINAILTPLLGMITTTVLIGVVGFGAWRVGQGYISTGELVAFILYLFQIIEPFIQLNSFVTGYQEANGATHRILKILDEIKEEDRTSNSKRISGPLSLELDQVSFGYQKGESILKNVSFDLQPGETVALVGPSGAGKSTIFSLIERFYQPDEGDIRINHVSYKDIDVFKWRELFSYVPQESSLFSGTVKENIMYGVNGDVSDEKIQKAAKLANAHEFIIRLSEGYDTEVGEKGANLSGGQKQRIAIARAFIRETPFLLLDESTANLDSESEKSITDVISNLGNDYTTFIIAHRLSTILTADKIIVLEDGQVKEIGQHRDLIQDSVYYHKMLYANQRNSG